MTPSEDTVLLTVPVQKDLKAQAEAILKENGLTPGRAVNAFYRQIVFHGGLPFAFSLPDDAAALSGDEIDSALQQGYADLLAGRAEPVSEDGGYALWLTKSAREDLAALERYAETEAPGLYQTITKALESLDALPERCPRLTTAPWNMLGCRLYAVGPARIYYLVSRADRQVTALRVFHTNDPEPDTKKDA